MTRLWRMLASLVVVAAMLWPVVRWEDGYPLSNYPMFSLARTTRIVVSHVVAFDGQGRGQPVPLAFWETDEVMQAVQSAKAATAAGPRAASALCEDLAKRVRADLDAFDEPPRYLEVRRDTFDTIAYWQGMRRPKQGLVLARCDVEAAP